MISLAQLNAMPREMFRSTLAGIFEHSPWVPDRAWSRRPFATITALHGAMCDSVTNADREEQTALIRAHPQLAGKAAIRGELSSASADEQSDAGLDQCSAEEYAEITRLNATYMEKFGFPFILAVRGHTRSSIIKALEERVNNNTDAEFDEALRQIEKIAGFRLETLLAITL
ncbi:MAG: 2-oxo-4-hydroxy-4-carboxy-5-ureidoimidazoline decarboxylase [Dokdonella sp.]